MTKAHGGPGYRRCNLVQDRTSENIRSEPSLTEIIEKRRTLQSTHAVPSDANHAPSPNTRQSRFLRIGQWASTITPALATSSIALRSHSAIRRSGTDNQTHSESEHKPGEASLQQTASPSQHSAVLEDRGQNLPHDYYEFEWFRVLIGMILLMVSEVIIFVLAISGKLLVVFYWQTILISIAIGLFLSLLYTGAFVVLTEYHEAVENFFNRYIRLRPGVQHACLRLFAYGYASIAIAAVVVVRNKGIRGPLTMTTHPQAEGRSAHTWRLG